MSSNIELAGFYDSIKAQEPYFGWLRRYMEITCVLNIAVVILTLYLIRKEGKNLKPEYKQVLLCNLFLPAVFSLYMGFIYQPYIVFPYHLLLTVGFFRFGPFVTAHLFNICCTLAILCSMGFIYSFWFNYITICFRISQQSSTKSNLIGLCVGLVFTIVNFVLMTIGVDEHQYEDRDALYKGDGRLRYFFDEYSIAIVRVGDKWSLKVLSVEAFIGIAIVVIVIPIITFKSHRTLNRIHNMISKTTLIQLKNALSISLWYLLQFGVLVGIPAATAMALLLLRYSPSESFPFALVVLAPTQLTCPVICALYLSVIKPLRFGFLRLIGLHKYVPKAVSKVSTQSQLSTFTSSHAPVRHITRNAYGAIRLN
uniref:G protein-coupled receptor n=2 Tax=Caenorhabditis tropicalis TaxID=1561998 RepID=A0A1I7URK0_9PELO